MLTERTGNRRGKHRQAEETKNSNTKRERGHHCVFAVGGAGESREPGIGVGRVEAPQSLGLACVGVGNEAFQGGFVDVIRGMFL